MDVDGLLCTGRGIYLAEEVNAALLLARFGKGTFKEVWDCGREGGRDGGSLLIYSLFSTSFMKLCKKRGASLLVGTGQISSKQWIFLFCLGSF